MEELIKAYVIFLKYAKSTSQVRYERGVLYIAVNPSIISTEDKDKLAVLGFGVREAEANGYLLYSFDVFGNN